MAVIHIRREPPKPDYRLGRALRAPRTSQPICGASAGPNDVTEADGKRMNVSNPGPSARANIRFFREHGHKLCPICFPEIML